MTRQLARRYRAPETYGRIGWRVRMAGRNLRWVRAQGLGRLIEEHELHPVHRAVTAARKAQWRRAHGVAPGEAVAVFLVGAPRSGTNMMVRGLASSPEFAVYNEGDKPAFHRYRLRPDPVVRELVVTSRHRFVLFKPLLDSHRILDLLDGLDLPSPPKALWAFRDVDGRARSALTKFGPSALFILGEVAAGRGSTRWQAQGLSDETRELLASLDWDRLTPADGAALLWYVRNKPFIELGLDRRADVLPLSYDTIVRLPVETMQVVCRFLELPYHPRLVGDIDQRAVGERRPLELEPRIRQLCDELGEQLQAAATAALTR